MPERQPSISSSRSTSGPTFDQIVVLAMVGDVPVTSAAQKGKQAYDPDKLFNRLLKKDFDLTSWRKLFHL